MFSLYKKELHSYYSSPFAYIIAALFMLVLSIAFVGNIANLSGTQFTFSFAGVFYQNSAFFIFLIPALTMRTFAEERRTGTEILLISSPLNVFQIVIAKFLAVSTVYLTILVLTLFFPIVTAMSGNVMWSSLLCGYLGFFLWGLVCIAIGMLMSSFTESPIIAAILGEGAMLILMFIDGIKNSGLFDSLPKVADVIGQLSTGERFLNFSQGIFRISDVVFFITTIVLFVGWTIISVEKRRWSRG